MEPGGPSAPYWPWDNMCPKSHACSTHGLPSFPRVLKFLLPAQQSSGPYLDHTWAAEPVQDTPVPWCPLASPHLQSGHILVLATIPQVVLHTNTILPLSP